MPSILFVCKANQFRSPLAAAISRKLLAEKGVSGSWQVDSAGTWATPGLPAIPSAVAAAQKLGLDLVGHRAIRVNEQSLSEYDLILVMEDNQKQALQSEFPALYENIYLLSHVLERRSYDFQDAFGSQQEADQVSADLYTLLQHGLDSMCILATYLHNTRLNATLQDE